MKHLGDITKIDWFKVEPVDVVTGGSPCQGLSVAGLRKGLEDERSGLYMEQIRCVKELRDADKRRGRTGQFVRPRYMVWENVPGAFSSGTPKGADFGAVIEEIIKVADPGTAVSVCVPDGGWTKSGCYYAEDGSWSIAWRVHDAQFWGATYYDAAGVPVKLGTPQRRKRIALVADFGGLSAPEILFERKGMSGDFETSGEEREGASGAAGGGAEGAGINGDVAGTLDASYYKGCGERMGVEREVVLQETYQTVTGPLMANSHPGSYCGQDAYTDMLVAHATTEASVIGFDCAYFNQGVNAKYDPQVFTDGTVPTQVARGPSGVCANSIVRRLTPLECERLQGYPDGWTLIGEPEEVEGKEIQYFYRDANGKKKRCTDSARYKALGNSIALPFWKWLAKRISAQYERDITMGSLFDGIGGFPLVFEQINGKGTARWASEVEEFCVAVTKKHFGED